MHTLQTFLRRAPLALLLAATVSHAQTLSCPPLDQMRQVNACPTEEQMRAHFSGFCSESSNAYQGKTGPCTDFQEFRRLKNTALWESVDSAFDGYLSCETPVSSTQKSNLTRMLLTQKGSITSVTCLYGSNVVLTHRTRKTCTVAPACASDPAQCQAVCE